MMTRIGEVLDWALGINAQNPSLWQMGLRAAVIYVVGLFIPLLSFSETAIAKTITPRSIARIGYGY